MRNMLNWMKKQIFIFMSYREYSSKIDILDFTQLRICRLQTTPSPPSSSLFWSGFYKCGMCWIKWKINFMIFIFRVIVKNHQKLAVLSTKMTISQKLNIAKIGILFFHSIQHIAHLSLKQEHNWGGRGWGGGVCLSLNTHSLKSF